MSTSYTEWIARGRKHQVELRAVDAMLCFRQAARIEPRAADSHFHLGEVQWQLGRRPEAIAAWRKALQLDPRFPAPAQALAEALLAVGEGAAARTAAEHVLSLAPSDSRARAIAAVGEMMVSQAAFGAAAHRLVRTLKQDPGLLSVPTIAVPLANALDRVSDSPERGRLLDGLTQIVMALSSWDSLPASLAALVCERIDTVAHPKEASKLLFDLALKRSYAPADHDALRRISMAVARADIADEAAFAKRYAELCMAFAPAVPMLWPRRTAGEKLRIVVLALPATEADEARDSLAQLAKLPPELFDIAIATVTGDAANLPLQSNVAPSSRSIALTNALDANDAKRCAAFDPDLAVDLIGRNAATGPLLASRFARRIVTPMTVRAANVAPLVDSNYASPGLLASMLNDLRRTISSTEGVPNASEMAMLWESAVRAHQQGDRDTARAAYLRVLHFQPGYAPAHYLLGVLLRDAGDLDAARVELDAAVASAPRFLDARIAAAKAAEAAGDPNAAVSICLQGLETQTENPVALYRTLGGALLAARDASRAEEAIVAALRLDATDGETHYNCGVALQMQGKGSDAARAYQRALAFKPDLTAAEFNLGALFQDQGATDAAVAAYQSVINAEASNVAAHKNLGEVLLAAGRVDAWIANFRRFEASCPDALAVAVQALEVYQHLGDYAAIDRYLDDLRRERFRASNEVELCDSLEQLLYLLLFFDVDPSIILRYSQSYDTAASRVYGAPMPRRDRRGDGRIRVGYLSADLRNHVMGKMMWQAIRYHDRSRFALYFYSLSRNRDEWTDRYSGIADRLDVIAGLDEHAAAKHIAEDDLDLLVDLSTHTKGSKPGILALKPARVQLTHIASAGVVGMSSIDFKLTDHYADVADNQRFQIETLLPIDACVYPYRHIAPATTHPFHRKVLGISDDAILIGAFVTPQKLSRRCLALWRDVLLRVESAKLVFSPANPAFRDAYVRLATAAGIPSDRLLFLPQGRDDAENQSRYELIDFVLDPLPFGGVNGTLEALDMGVPVVTLVGKRHGERVGLSMLTHLGVTETIATTGQEYVALAVRLAKDPLFRGNVRTAIRTGLARSPLTDGAAHTQALEQAYLAALAAKAPEVLSVADADGR